MSHGRSEKDLIPGKENSPSDLARRNPLSPPPIHRVTYEYPPPPKAKPHVPKESSVWKRHMPLMFAVGGLLWAGYAAYYFFGDGKASEQTILSPTAFTQYRITCKQQISDDTILLEISPKYAATKSMLESGATLWNAKKLWSIQIKHPMIQIARNYTPLPIYFMQSDRVGEAPLVRMMGSATDEGRMSLLIKRYEDGEMSRYLHSLPVGSDIDVRGPFVDCKFPYTQADSQPLRQPMLDVPSRMSPEKELDPNSGIIKAPNFAMFTAGTGITTAFQLLLSPHNPPRGFVDVYHSARKMEDVPFQRYMLFLESVGRAKFHIFLDDEKRFISLKDIPSPHKDNGEVIDQPGALSVDKLVPRKYTSAVQQCMDKDNVGAYSEGVSYAVVCGPPGYITYVAGNPGYDNVTPIEGLLGLKGWNHSNTFRMSDL